MIIVPTVLGARCLFNSKLRRAFSFSDKIKSMFETASALIFQEEDYEIYNVSLSTMLMSDEPEDVAVETEEVAPDAEEPPIVSVVAEIAETPAEEGEAKPAAKKGKKELSPEEIAEQERLQKIIAAREIIEVDPVHLAIEYETTGRGKIMIGPQTITRIEKARILCARAIQLTHGTPTFIPDPIS